MAAKKTGTKPKSVELLDIKRADVTASKVLDALTGGLAKTRMKANRSLTWYKGSIWHKDSDKGF